MPYIMSDQAATGVSAYDVYSLASGALLPVPMGVVFRGFDPALGGGEFIFAKASEALAAGDVVEITVSASGGNYTYSVQKWRATTASVGQQLAVALAAVTSGAYGFFQVEGLAIVNSNGTTAAGDRAFWQANGVVSTTLVAGKQALGMNAMSAANATVSGYGAIGAAKSLYMLQRPFGQGNIT
jgi:hypothetical protein